MTKRAMKGDTVETTMDIVNHNAPYARGGKQGETTIDVPQGTRLTAATSQLGASIVVHVKTPEGDRVCPTLKEPEWKLIQNRDA